MNILIRTSGGTAPKKEMGYGHVFRTINLADNLQKNKISFLLEDFGGAKKILSSRGYTTIIILKKEITLKEDIEKTIEIIKKYNIDLLIIDRYHLKQRYVSVIRKYVRIVVISDLRNIDYHSDLIINGFIGYKNKVSLNTYHSRCLLGPSYQILNREFSKTTKRKKKIDLLATFGGFDESYIVNTLLGALEKYHKKIKVRIILGPGTPHSQEIRSFERRYGKNLQVIQSTKFMHNEMSSARFGICAGGITTYEFAACGVPFGIVSQVKHQLTTAREWQKNGIAKDLGLLNTKTKKKIEEFLESIINKQFSPKKIRIVDGFGAKRVSREITALKHLKEQ